MRVFAVNTIAPLQLVEAMKPNLLLGKHKVIALMSSKMASLSDNTSGGSIIYRSSKAALNAVGKSLAADLSAEDIMVALLHPGWVQTDMGGPNALINTQESVVGLRNVLKQLTPEQSGQFFNYDGTVLPW
jgi:NAD(P)-dependent dehydrogenase (short-subunit alcohol dehydrogenase family)